MLIDDLLQKEKEKKKQNSHHVLVAIEG